MLVCRRSWFRQPVARDNILTSYCVVFREYAKCLRIDGSPFVCVFFLFESIVVECFLEAINGSGNAAIFTLLRITVPARAI